MEKANNFRSTIKFTADHEMSKRKITFLDTKVCKGVSYNKELILDVQTNRNLSVHEILFVSPTRRKERLHSGRSARIALQPSRR